MIHSVGYMQFVLEQINQKLSLGWNIQLGNDKSPFYMTVSDKFRISGVGVMITGIVESGSINVGDTINIGDKSDKVSKIFKDKYNVQTATVGDNVGLVLPNMQMKYVELGMEVTID
ncbi:MAG: hypothetical protein IKZ99_11155, partial [Salinivirgaceae bacterium]|nr:hypothetical protein [Salinivirgaceae bacterium]